MEQTLPYVGRWEPLEVARRLFSWPPLTGDDGFPWVGTSGLDIYETDDEIVVKAPVPGVPPEDVNVTFENGVLRIQASHEETEAEKKAKKSVYQQRRLTSFDYTTTLPRAVDGNKITAEISDGVVTVSAPLAEAAKPKKIAIKSGAKRTS